MYPVIKYQEIHKYIPEIYPVLKYQEIHEYTPEIYPVLRLYSISQSMKKKKERESVKKV